MGVKNLSNEAISLYIYFNIRIEQICYVVKGNYMNKL